MRPLTPETPVDPWLILGVGGRGYHHSYCFPERRVYGRRVRYSLPFREDGNGSAPLKHGKLERGLPGVNIQDVTQALAKSF